MLGVDTVSQVLSHLPPATHPPPPPPHARHVPWFASWTCPAPLKSQLQWIPISGSSAAGSPSDPAGLAEGSLQESTAP